MKKTALLIAALCLEGMVFAKPVYKCAEGGKTVYSHEPCIDAEIVDTTPTQGLDKMSGRSKKGSDVRKDESANYWADNVSRPLYGGTREQLKTSVRRQKLSPNDKAACYRLDSALKSSAGQALLDARRKYNSLGC